MLRALKCLSLAGVLAVAVMPETHAQPAFTAPVGEEFIYGSANVVRPTNVSSYSISIGGFDLYLAGWSLPLNGAPSEVVWQYTDIGNPTSIAGQGVIPYLAVADLGTGIVYNSATGRYNYLVVYYKLGVGHFLDIYDVSIPVVPTAAPVYNTTIQLSNATTYGRIRIDSHGQFAAAIVWENPGIGIQTVACHNGTWSTPTTLNGTGNESAPDVALMGYGGTVYVHYAYYNAGTGTITESSIDRNVLLTSPATATPVIEDIYGAGTGITSDVVLDCPDNYNVPNWAYTFTDGVKVLVRYMDHNTSATPNVIAVNDGSLFNTPTMPWYEAYAPSLHYGAGAYGGPTGEITVAWYLSDNVSTHGYVALEMRSDGSSLMSAPDYMSLPNAFTPVKYPFYNVWYPKTAGIALSKNSDINFAPGRLYAAFFDFDAALGAYPLHHAFHQWGNTVFKGEAPQGGIGTTAGALSLEVYPNPFAGEFKASVVLPEQGQVCLKLSDITGREVWQHRETLDKGTHQVRTGDMSRLAPGVYVLTASVNNKTIGTRMLTRK